MKFERFTPGPLCRLSVSCVRFVSGFALGLASLLSMVSLVQRTPLPGEGGLRNVRDPARVLQPAPHGSSSYAYCLIGNPADVATRARPGLEDPFHDQITLVRDFLNLPHLGGVILESHFVQHDRMGGLVTFLGRILESEWTCEARGIGIQSNTALLVEADGSALVVAAADAIVPAAYFLRIIRESAMCRAREPLVVRLVTVDQVRPGETFSLRTWRGPRMVSFSLAAVEGVLESSHGSRALYPE